MLNNKALLTEKGKFFDSLGWVGEILGIWRDTYCDFTYCDFTIEDLNEFINGCLYCTMSNDYKMGYVSDNYNIIKSLATLQSETDEGRTWSITWYHRDNLEIEFGVTLDAPNTFKSLSENPHPLTGIESTTKAKRLTRREFVRIHDEAVNKMFDGENGETLGIYGKDVLVYWNGFYCNCADGAQASNYIFPAIFDECEELDDEYDEEQTANANKKEV